MSVFSNDPNSPYTYLVNGRPATQAQPQRQYNGPETYAPQGTSSAFSSSANPDEDWTKISDLAERRRIQNRIAQRNYRKKLKRRLEDLERRAGSPESGENDKSSPQPAKTKRPSPSKASKPRPQPRLPKPSPQMQFTPPMESNDELLFPSVAAQRERSHTPPYYATYSAAYPAPHDDSFLQQPYTTPESYQPMTTTMDSYPAYMAPGAMPSTLPSTTHFSDAFKREPYSADNGLSQYSYDYFTGMDINTPSPFDQSNPHTPPLSNSFEHSANCSDSSYEYPNTPLSMPGSPAMPSLGVYK